jgi:cytochrome c oxidase assembly protein subunit 11
MTDSTPPASQPLLPVADARRNRRVALFGMALVSTMFATAFAAVPLYDWFCRVTGIGGTTQVATAAPVQPIDRTITVRFDANVRNLPWRFTAPAPMTVRIGEVATATYVVENRSEADITVGTATYNVVPLVTGGYFNKLQCFCFTEQTVKPGERIEMPVVFFVDPAIVKDRQAGTASAITLSYTFAPVVTPARPVAAAPAPATRL